MLGKLRLTLVCTAFAVALFLLFQAYVPVWAVSPAGRELIRLHIMAHSDHPRDQALKLKVRDAIVEETAPLFSTAATERDAERVLSRHLNQVEEIADRVLMQAGALYQSQAELGTYSFPERRYENMTLPAGRYRALRIVLGDGQGHNWWCVLFPPLCFVNGSSGQEATPVMDVPPGLAEEAQRVMAAGKTKPEEPAAAENEVEIRFKVVEVWEKVRPRARALLSCLSP